MVIPRNLTLPTELFHELPTTTCRRLLVVFLVSARASQPVRLSPAIQRTCTPVASINPTSRLLGRKCTVLFAHLAGANSMHRMRPTVPAWASLGAQPWPTPAPPISQDRPEHKGSCRTSLPFNPTEARMPLHGRPVLHPGHRRHSNDNPHGTTLPGCFWVTQSLPFGSLGTGSEARWLEGGSTFPAEPVPRSLARQQQVPKTEPTSAACFGGGRHGVGPSPSAETEKRRHLGHFGLPPASV